MPETRSLSLRLKELSVYYHKTYRKENGQFIAEDTPFLLHEDVLRVLADAERSTPAEPQQAASAGVSPELISEDVKQRLRGAIEDLRWHARLASQAHRSDAGGRMCEEADAIETVLAVLREAQSPPPAFGGVSREMQLTQERDDARRLAKVEASRREAVGVALQLMADRAEKAVWGTAGHVRVWLLADMRTLAFGAQKPTSAALLTAQPSAQEEK